MPRTYSLARLMLAVTIFCMLCGLATRFPAVLLMCAPTTFVLVLLASLSRRPAVLSLLSFIAAAIVFVIAPALGYELFGYPHNWWERYRDDAFLPALAALLVGGTILLYEVSSERM